MGGWVGGLSKLVYTERERRYPGQHNQRHLPRLLGRWVGGWVGELCIGRSRSR